MSTKRIRTEPDLSLTSPNHQGKSKEELINSCFNVIDEYKGMSVDEIKVRLRETQFPFAVAMENWINEFNFSGLVRNANAFNSEAVYYLGDKHFDRRGAQGTYHYTDVNFIPSIDQLLELKSRYTFVGIDNVQGSISIDDYEFPSRPLFIFGSEGTGLTPTMQSFCRDIIRIDQFGSVRSLNAAVASGIVMHTYVSYLQRECGHSNLSNNQCRRCHKRFPNE